MNNLSKYLFESMEKSDDALIYQLAKNVWRWVSRSKKNQNPKYYNKLIKDYGIKENPRRGLIKWYKDNFPKLLDKEREVIKRDDWVVDELIGQTENQIMHTHYAHIMDYLLKHPRKRNDILLVFECSNKKPYNDDHAKQIYINLFDDVVDFANADYGLIPYSFCELYPYRYDEWDHFNEGEYGSWWYREVSKINFKLFMDAWGYKKCIIIVQNKHPRRFLTEIKENNLYGYGDKIEMVIDDEYDKYLWDKYEDTFHNPGLLITRTLGLPETILKTCKVIKTALKEIGESKDKIDKLSKIQNIVNTFMKKGERPGRYLRKEKLMVEDPISRYPYTYDVKDDIDKSYEYNDKVSKENQKEYESYFISKLKKLEKKLDNVDIDEVKDQKVAKDMGDIDLVKNPDDLYNIYEWAWPCGKMLYWMYDKKLRDTLQTDYEQLRSFMQKQSNWGCINNYFFYYKPLVDKLGWSEKDVKKKALTIHFIEENPLNYNIKDYIY